ncbi:MAG TPA: WYL domain-containing protein [Actinomycetota bacterium]|nr:WYL domain-containing protein [Actinomycetota bacterium]
MAERRASVKVEERLARMLVVVPYLIRHPGTTLDEAATVFAIPIPQLRRDLEQLFLAGLPPYGPGDLIDVDIDEDGGIWIAMADHFARPLRLTRQEALAVYVRATELAATPGVPVAPALNAALAKLRDALGAEALGEAAGIAGAEPGTPPEHLDTVRAASGSHERLRIAYVAQSTGERTERVVDPEAVFASAGHWYAAVWDVEVDDERLLRIDRIASVEPAGERFAPRGLRGAGRPLYTPSDRDVDVRVRLHPAARWVAEYYLARDVAEGPDGSLEVTLPTATTRWIARLFLRLGTDAEVLEPPGLREEIEAEARATLERYAAASA